MISSQSTFLEKLALVSISFVMFLAGLKSILTARFGECCFRFERFRTFQRSSYVGASLIPYRVSSSLVFELKRLAGYDDFTEFVSAKYANTCVPRNIPRVPPSFCVYFDSRGYKVLHLRI